MKSFLILALAVTSLQLTTTSAHAIRLFRNCECYGDYKPPRGAIKISSCRIRTEWETRYHCLPCGNRIPYEVKVITFRDRYSNGATRVWKCVVRGKETHPVK
ncbi:MAG: hypothetical protein AAGA96_02550 [Verrucomicrobiota bacterium]